MSHSSSEDNSTNSLFTKFLGILVVIVILAVVVYKLTTSEEEQSTTTEQVNNEQQQAEAPPDNVTEAPEVSTPAEANDVVVDDNTATAPGGTNVINSEQDKKEIRQFLEEWKTAWQKSAGTNGNSANYFAFYADEFTSGSLNKTQWQKSKKIRNQGKNWIEVWMNDLRISAKADGTYVVTFRQEYSSSNYSDKGIKELIVKKGDSGWKIITETAIK